jgi:hypothetical protein
VDDAGAILETYLNIAFSFSRGVVRIWGAEAASARLLCALKGFQTLDQPSREGPAAAVLQHLARVPYNSIESLAYVTNVSHLLYATTLFDTFLSETIQFLFLLRPRAIGEEQPVPLRALIDATSKSEAITQAASARAREIGYLPFTERIEFLRETFGLEITVSTETASGLAHFSSNRDSAGRDQGSRPLQLDERGDVIFTQNVPAKNAAAHLSPKIGRDDVRWAVDSYEQSARAIARAVFTQVLKQSDHPAVQLVLKGSTARLELNAS